jgi:hypothetical protein
LTYLAAPVLGAVLGMNLYDLFLAPESELKAQSKAMEQAPAKKVAKSKK